MTLPVIPADQCFEDWLADSTRRPLFVGYSGGVDSHLLLYELCARVSAANVIALHINHGLSPRANGWQRHCERQCQLLGCGFETYSVSIKTAGEGLEAAARDERYRAFMERVPPEHSLWLGHHLDDQLETFLQRLLRGSGLNGLTAMSGQLSRQQRHIRRPLLSTTRHDIESRARKLGLDWIEDDSNSDTRFDRNFLRQQVLPLIESRWPSYRQTLTRSLSHLKQAAHQQNAWLDTELEHRLAQDGALRAVQLDDWPEDQIEALIHRWLQRQSVRSPSESILQRIVREVVGARIDAQPAVHFGDGSVRRFRSALYWVPTLAEPSDPPSFLTGEWLDWSGIGLLRLEPALQGAGRIRISPAGWRWQLRQGGESIWPAGRSARRDLKRLLQEYRLPPWLRDRVPLLFAGDQLVAVADLAVDKDWQASVDEPGWRITWRLRDGSEPALSE